MIFLTHQFDQTFDFSHQPNIPLQYFYPETSAHVAVDVLKRWV